MRASSGALRLSWSQPIRILTVTGTVTAFDRRFHQPDRQRHLAHQRAARELTDDLAHRAAEVDVDDRRAVGLPAVRAASAIEPGSQPTSCIETGSSIGSHSAFWIDWRVSRIAASLAIISVTLSPEP